MTRRVTFSLRSAGAFLFALSLILICSGWWIRRSAQVKDAVTSIERAQGWVFYDDSFFSDGRLREPTAFETCIDSYLGREYRSSVDTIGIPEDGIMDPVVQKKIESLIPISVLIVSCRDGAQRECEKRVRRRFPKLNIEVRGDLMEMVE